MPVCCASCPPSKTRGLPGDIDRAHVTTLLGARNTRTAEVFDADGHQWLLDFARTNGFQDFKAACDRWAMIVDPDGAEQGAEDDRNARELFFAKSFGGMWFGKMTLDPNSGEIVDTTLREIERELFDADWAEAKARLGCQPTLLDLPRTPAQRRADALVEMAIRARTAPADGRRPVPLFTVVVGLETLKARSAWRDVSPALPGGSGHHWSASTAEAPKCRKPLLR